MRCPTQPMSFILHQRGDFHCVQYAFSSQIGDILCLIIILQMKGSLHRRHSTLQRESNILRIKSSLRNIPIISRNQTRILKRISMAELPQSDCSSDTQSVQNEEEPHASPFTIDHAQLFHQKYELLQKLGQGSNGVVHRCVKRRTGQSFAVKSFMFDDEQMPQLKANFQLMRSLAHPNIIRYEALYIDTVKHAGWLVMELVVAPSLSRVQLGGEKELKGIMGQLFDSLAYLHRRAIAHRDIKMENILMEAQGKKIKVIDFGICRKHRRRGIKFEMWTITGTLFYRAPEMFTGGGYSQNVDVWAAGVLLYKLVAARTPFESQYHNKTIDNILRKEVDFQGQFQKYSPQLTALIKRTLNRDPESRPTASDCLSDRWFTGEANPERLIEEIQSDWEGLSPTDLHNRHSYRSYIKQINGEQFHCIDSEDESASSPLKKRPQKIISLQELEYLPL